jgi:hypothetical protein
LQKFGSRFALEAESLKLSKAKYFSSSLTSIEIDERATGSTDVERQE